MLRFAHITSYKHYYRALRLRQREEKSQRYVIFTNLIAKMAHFIGCNEYNGFSGYAPARSEGENTQNLRFFAVCRVYPYKTGYVSNVSVVTTGQIMMRQIIALDRAKDVHFCFILLLFPEIV